MKKIYILYYLFRIRVSSRNKKLYVYRNITHRIIFGKTN